MSNMSYCQFQNTEDDLAYCVDALERAEDDLNAAEQAAAFRMVHLCERYLEAYGNYTPPEDDDDE